MSTKKVKSLTKNIAPINPPAVTLTNFSIVFNKGKTNESVLIDNLNYQFEQNKIHFIVGPSGCGKTTLISYFNGLNVPENKTITIFDRPIIVKRNKKIKRVKSLRSKIGMVFQFAEYQLFKSTIEKDIIFGPLNFGVKNKEAKKNAAEMIERVGLNQSFLPRNPFGLSGGQKRRVAIAGILAINTDIIIFDEPTAGLDPKGEQDMLNLFVKLKSQGKTIIVVTHSMNHALQIADNVVVINHNKIVKTGDIYDVFADKKVVNEANLYTPLVIQIVDKLIHHNKKYAVLYRMRPRNEFELIKCVKEVSR
jgi:energy-coupling factor transport system ATP-binding protein